MPYSIAPIYEFFYPFPVFVRIGRQEGESINGLGVKETLLLPVGIVFDLLELSNKRNKEEFEE